MTRRHKAPYLSRQLARAHNVLCDPTAIDEQRHAARCRLNKTLTILHALQPIPQMKRGLEIDRIPVWMRPTAA